MKEGYGSVRCGGMEVWSCEERGEWRCEIMGIMHVMA